jgi:hypothetical protein
MAKVKKLSPTQQWMLDHPSDTPCPKMPDAAAAWRRKRGLEIDGRNRELWDKYHAAMAEKRAHEAAMAEKQARDL